MQFSPLIILLLCVACRSSENGAVALPGNGILSASVDSIMPALGALRAHPDNEVALVVDDIKPITTVAPRELVDFAKSQTGVPYKYASTDPLIGFDCSGFITYVFNHFNIKVPRSSVDFTNVGTEVDIAGAKEGDLILFTGTNDSIRIVGHMGIVVENTDTLKFIHSTSGRAMGVTISPFSEHYRKRFMKVVRLFGE
jgi:cell wall-associated NlpC family hydrolase